MSACAFRSRRPCTWTIMTSGASLELLMTMTGAAMRDTRCRASSNVRPMSLVTRLFTVGRKTRRGRPLTPKARVFRASCARAAFPWIDRAWPARPVKRACQRLHSARLIRANARRETLMIDISRPHHSALRAAAVVLISLMLCACDSAGAGTGAYPADAGDLGLIQDAMKQVEKNYVAPVTGGELAKDALKGMLTRLDPHSDYMDQEQYQQMAAVTRGQFGGIGVELTLEGKVPEVISPIDGTPAAEAGIEPGDRIVKIDALPTTGMDVEEVVKRLRGPAGSRVTLSIARNDRGAFDVTLTRNVIRVVSVKSDLKPNNIGYARITTFTENTASELVGAIERMKARTQGRLNGFVLDLRNDPGGLLDASIDVAGIFLDGGVVVTTRGRNTTDDHIYRAQAAGDVLRGTA